MVFSSEDAWRNHSVSCNEKKPFVCEVCHLGFSGENEMMQHKVEYHGNGQTMSMDLPLDVVKSELDNTSGGVLHNGVKVSCELP